MARPGPKINRIKQAAFLAAYAKVGNLTCAARLSKCDRNNHYRWLREDPDYPQRYKEAGDEALDSLEAEARRRAVEGVERPVFNSKGEKVGAVRKYSDTLLIFLLKGANPEKYRDRFDHQHSGTGGGPIQTAVTIQQVMDLLDARDARPKKGET